MGLKGFNREPRADPRARRNSQNLSGQAEFVPLNGAIQVDAEGMLAIVIAANQALESVDAGLRLNLDADSSLSVVDGALTIVLRDTTMVQDASGIGVKLAENGGIGTSADGLLIVGGIPITTETPTGTIDGANDEFTLANIPLEGEVLLFHNGLLVFNDASGDYERDGTGLTFKAGAIPETGDRLLAVYLEGVGALGEQPSGLVDGLNDTFTTSSTPKPDSMMLFHNGVLLAQGATADYTLDESTITFDASGIPVAGDQLFAAYERDEA